MRMTLTLNLLVAAFIAYEIYDGAAWTTFRYSNASYHAIPQRVYRDDSPGFYWWTIGWQTLVLAYLIAR